MNGLIPGLEKIDIEPYDCTKVAHYVSIYRGEVYFKQFVTVEVSLYDANNEFIERKYVKLEGDDYNNWYDDDVLTELVLSRLGLTKLRLNV